MTAPTPAEQATDRAGLLDRLQKARQAALAIRNNYPSLPTLIQNQGDVLAAWSDEALMVWLECDDEPVAEWIVEITNAAPELLRLARRGRALEAGVLALAVRFETLGEVLHSVPAADAYDDAGQSLRALVADTTGEATA